MDGLDRWIDGWINGWLDEWTDALTELKECKNASWIHVFFYKKPDFSASLHVS